jgi:5'-AMP-activated protein kinase catalytic alpha subunit
MENDYSDINNYEMEKEIGEGNFGKVKLAKFKPTGEEFAIKILNKKKIKKQMKNVMLRENEIITKLNHINIVFVYKIIETEEDYFIVMEYCKLGELFDYIVKKKRLEEEEAAVFFYQLINGVEYIHSKGIAHRDLKPENLLLTEDKVLKIIDFGLSHEFTEDEFLKTKCGSPSYAAPEIIAKPKMMDLKMIYGVMVLFYMQICMVIYLLMEIMIVKKKSSII